MLDISGIACGSSLKLAQQTRFIVADCQSDFLYANSRSDWRINGYFKIPISDSEWNVNHRNVTGRRLEMTDLVIKEHVWAQDCENTVLLHATQKECLIH
ncbi:hypothetical protein FB106_10777 [Synechococcus sp. Ace-Pa]|nr:hypothetical protein FB106_10777 [Synechococcus sp. Ace-Pa]